MGFMTVLKIYQNIKVALKPHLTIGSLFPRPKDPVPKDQARGVIYSIPCKDCEKLYIGETKRKFNTRLREHKKAVEQKHPKKFVLAEHCLQSGHARGNHLQYYVPAQVGETDAF